MAENRRSILYVVLSLFSMPVANLIKNFRPRIGFAHSSRILLVTRATSDMILRRRILLDVVTVTALHIGVRIIRHLS